MNEEKNVEGMIMIVEDVGMVEEMGMEVEWVKKLKKDVNGIVWSIYDEMVVVNGKGELVG